MPLPDMDRVGSFDGSKCWGRQILGENSGVAPGSKGRTPVRSYCRIVGRVGPEWPIRGQKSQSGRLFAASVPPLHVLFQDPLELLYQSLSF